MAAGCETFIGEPIQPTPGTFDTRMLARGGPAVPRIFTWRGREYRIARVIESWYTRERGVGMDRGHRYVRKHYYRIETATGEVMTLCFDRKPPSSGDRKARWRLWSMQAE